MYGPIEERTAPQHRNLSSPDPLAIPSFPLSVFTTIWHRWIQHIPRHGKYLVQLSKTRQCDSFHARFAGLLPKQHAWGTLHIRNLENAVDIYYGHIRRTYGWYPDDGPWHSKNGDYLTVEEVKKKAGTKVNYDMLQGLSTELRVAQDNIMGEIEDMSERLERSTTPDINDMHSPCYTLKYSCQRRSQTPPPPCRHDRVDWSCDRCELQYLLPEL